MLLSVLTIHPPLHIAIHFLFPLSLSLSLSPSLPSFLPPSIPLSLSLSLSFSIFLLLYLSLFTHYSVYRRITIWLTPKSKFRVVRGTEKSTRHSTFKKHNCFIHCRHNAILRRMGYYSAHSASSFRRLNSLAVPIYTFSLDRALVLGL